jgi:hypothetical protein
MSDIKDYKRKFLETAISACFFRIPQYREMFLSIVDTAEPGKLILERRQTSALNLIRMFDWQVSLYDKIPLEKQEESLKILKEVLQNPDSKWKERMRKRGNAFFKIIKAWVEYVQRSIVVLEVNWKDIPGYRDIVKVLLHQVKIQDVHFYPESLREATLSFLCNVKLLNELVVTQFTKTHVYDSLAVIKTMELVAAWFMRIHSNH